MGRANFHADIIKARFCKALQFSFGTTSTAEVLYPSDHNGMLPLLRLICHSSLRDKGCRFLGFLDRDQTSTLESRPRRSLESTWSTARTSERTPWHVAKVLARIEKYWSACFGRSTESFIFALLAQWTLVKANLSRYLSRDDLVSTPGPPQSMEDRLVVHAQAQARTTLNVRANSLLIS